METNRSDIRLRIDKMIENKNLLNREVFDCSDV